MPLEPKPETGGRKPATRWWWPWIENIFWIGVFIAAYIAMMKVMHPGFTFFGI
ncbi:MAG: hypothetical protein AB1529_01020 [Candidatus Micrarchaeota archaeon]